MKYTEAMFFFLFTKMTTIKWISISIVFVNSSSTKSSLNQNFEYAALMTSPYRGAIGIEEDKLIALLENTFLG